jgi:hypothetical protein
MSGFSRDGARVVFIAAEAAPTGFDCALLKIVKS